MVRRCEANREDGNTYWVVWGAKPVSEFFSWAPKVLGRLQAWVFLRILVVQMILRGFWGIFLSISGGERYFVLRGGRV
ncbi:MAG: hypothetical protein D6805_09785 [Planctomycetota bacterium]|nr:MAG: hypothetical protein D6805_09785 [Planctomycetota bacterium]